MGIHYFDVDIAKEYGVNAAVIFQNIVHWVDHNRANGTNFYDGKFWTYNSNRAFCELFPYLTSKQIRSAIEKLIEEGLIETGVYNKDTRDRTLWYTLTEKGACICHEGRAHLPLRADTFATEGTALPDINHIINPDKKDDVCARTAKRFTQPTLEDVRAYCRERNNNVDAERFYDYYTSNGWKVGRNPMKDWKAAVRRWERHGWNGYGFGGQQQKMNPSNLPEDANDLRHIFGD